MQVDRNYLLAGFLILTLLLYSVYAFHTLLGASLWSNTFYAVPSDVLVSSLYLHTHG